MSASAGATPVPAAPLSSTSPAWWPGTWGMGAPARAAWGARTSSTWCARLMTDGQQQMGGRGFEQETCRVKRLILWTVGREQFYLVQIKLVQSIKTGFLNAAQTWCAAWF